jgi:crotonobetainyl-CoA:carnitine CoA-transferase CaiB-like acyl-CoA transferase
MHGLWLFHTTGFEDTPPTRVGVSIGDVGAGLYAMIGAQSALIHRSKSGRGMHVDVSMLDVQLALMNQVRVCVCAHGALMVPGWLLSYFDRFVKWAVGHSHDTRVWIMWACWCGAKQHARG